MVALARGWADAEEGTLVPVLVDAAELLAEGPLHEILTASVRSSLGAVGSMRSWDPDFFRTAPAAGARWLVLVDGLDEIMDPAQRLAVLNRLRGIRALEGSSRHVITLTTRPVPELPLDDLLGPDTQKYELLPFEATAVADFALRWFEALDSADPPQERDAFLTAVRKAGIGGLTRIPLMATMLCQLHLAHSALPTNRRDIHRLFIDLVIKRQFSAGPGGLQVQTDRILSRYGSHAVAVGDSLRDRIRPLISALALARRDGSTEPALSLVARHCAVPRPEFLGEADWDALLSESLRRSGLLLERNGDFVFVHQSIAEYLAAEAAAAEPRRAGREFRRLFGSPWNPRTPDTALSDEPYARFLIAEWAAGERAGALRSVLRRLARTGEGAGLVASLVRDGVSTGDDVARLAVSTLRTRIVHGVTKTPAPSHVRAAAALLALGEEAGGHLLHTVVTRPPLTPDDSARSVRRLAGQLWAEIDEAPAADALKVVALNTELAPEERLWAVELLFETSAHAWADVRDHIYDDDAFDPWDVAGYERLARIGDPRGVETLRRRARNLAGRLWQLSNELHGPEDPQEEAAEVAEVASPAPFFEMWEGAAGHPSAFTTKLVHTRHHRKQAERELDRLREQTRSLEKHSRAIKHDAEVLGALLRLGDPVAVDVLRALAASTVVSTSIRIRAASTSHRHGDPAGVEALARMACDPLTAASDRTAAGVAMARADALRGGSLIAAMAMDETHPEARRLLAMGTLWAMQDPRGADLLAATATNSRLRDGFRIRAASMLLRLGDPRAESLVRSIAVDAAQPARVRRLAALALWDWSGRPEDAAGRDVLVRLVLAPDTPAPMRGHAALLLGRLGDPRARAVLLALARSSRSSDAFKLAAATRLWEMGAQGALGLIVDFLNDSRASVRLVTGATHLLLRTAPEAARHRMGTILADPATPPDLLHALVGTLWSVSEDAGLPAPIRLQAFDLLSSNFDGGRPGWPQVALPLMQQLAKEHVAIMKEAERTEELIERSVRLARAASYGAPRQARQRPDG